MSKHRFARFVAIVLLILAVLVLVGGILGSLVISSRGFGSGWSEGWRGWFTIPIIALSCSGAFWLLLLGSILLVLVDISNNMAKVRLAAAAKPVFVEAPVAAIPAVIEQPGPVQAVIEAPSVVPVAAAATAVAVAEKATRKPAKATTAPPSAEAKGMTAARAQAEAEARAAAERAEAVPVGVPVTEPDTSARSATVEITEAPAVEETVAPAVVAEEVVAPPKPKRTRTRAAKTAAAAVAAVAAAEMVKPDEEPEVAVVTPSDADLVALTAAVEALEAGAEVEAPAPGEPRLPGAEDAARIAAELAAIKVVETGATKAKRERKQAKFSARLVYVGGINEATAEKFSEMGVRTTEDLLERGATRKGRQELAEQTGLTTREILTWVNHIDLFRIRGVGEEYAILLEASGVDTVVELAQRNASNLQAKLVSVNNELHLVRQVPVITQVERWIEDAKTLPRVVKY